MSIFHTAAYPLKFCYLGMIVMMRVVSGPENKEVFKLSLAKWR